MRSDLKNPNLIVKNGALLFLRLLLVMAMAFYTTRLTLQVLGDEDYGINNIIGGVISMFAIISMPITGALQRFFNVEFTKQEIPKRVVFNTSLRVVVLLTIVMVALYETIGLYLVNWVLKYPAERTIAVNIIFQLTVLSTICNFFSLAYSALLVAKEDMGIPATVEVLAALLKLVFLLIIPFISYDALIIYSTAILLTSVFQLLFYFSYCWRKYDESHFGKKRDRTLQNEILKFSSWSFVNSVAGITLTYFSNVLINLFGGILYNTAYGISQQLSNAIGSFSTNVLRAADPQITSACVANNSNYRDQLVLSTMKLCFFGVGFVFVVFVFYGESLLNIWLNNVPNHVLSFSRVALMNVLITSIVLPFRTIILASGDIKRFYLNYLYIAILSLLTMFFLLRSGFPVIIVMYLILAAGIAYLINAIIIVHKTTTLDYLRVLKDICRVAFTLLLGSLLIWFLKNEMKASVLSFVFITIASFIIATLVAYFCATNQSEKQYINRIVKRILKKNE